MATKIKSRKRKELRQTDARTLRQINQYYRDLYGWPGSGGMRTEYLISINVTLRKLLSDSRVMGKHFKKMNILLRKPKRQGKLPVEHPLVKEYTG